MRRHPGRTALAVLCAAGLLAACSNSGGSRSTERPLTLDEATLLASAQYDNYQDGGATFQVATAFIVSGDTLNLQGMVDWKQHTGYAVVAAKGAEEGITEVFWTQNAVLERRPAADDLLQGIGYRGVKWFARAPEPSTRLLDRALAIINGLASTERDNPQLLQQKPGSAFVRTDTLRERTVNLLRFGTRNIYWLDTSTNRMLRFEGNAEAGGAPTIVDILTRGSQTITFPLVAEVVEVDAVRELYDALQQIGTPAERITAGSGS